MPVATHIQAADDHKKAAQAHENAAALHGKGDHTAALEKSTKAKGCCDTAQKSTTEACKQSAMQAKS
jgi:hypothetical protein